MILKVVLMLVSCLKMSFEGCMSLLHSELILACWVKYLHIGWIVNYPYSHDHVSWNTFEDECSQGGDIVIPRIRNACQSLNLEILGKELSTVKMQNGHLNGQSCSQRSMKDTVSPGEMTKTASTTGRLPQNTPWCCPYKCLLTKFQDHS